MEIKMSNIRIISLYSGSSGNATLIETPECSILIDAGKSARSLTNALKQAGSDPGSIKAVFITHEHTDHTSALEVFVKKNPIPIHITGASANNMHMSPESRVRPLLSIHPPIFSERVGNLTVTSFPLSHDSASCVGYTIETDDGYKFGYATDTGYVTPAMEKELAGCDAVVVESNHSVEMLKYGPYPADVKRRIMSRSGHLSNDDCASFVKRLASLGTKNFMLAHISGENNRPECALEAVKNALGSFEETTVCVAKPETETYFIG